MPQYAYLSPNTPAYSNTSGYHHFSSVDMAPSQSQSSDSSGTASPLSPLGHYHSSTSNIAYYDQQRNDYAQMLPPSGHNSQTCTSQRRRVQGNSSTKKQKIALHLYPISHFTIHQLLKNLLLTIGPELSRTSKPKPYVCLHSGCETSFTRPFDLGRHMKTTHQAGVRIDCPEGWCGRSGLPDGREKGGFSRADHFYEHVSKVHRKVVVKDANGAMYVRSTDGRESEVRVTYP
ncbi:hypothetical protein MMC29_001832 [Sticta canariensis]|nr:hypothetical protein [Sticta canariensis]